MSSSLRSHVVAAASDETMALPAGRMLASSAVLPEGDDALWMDGRVGRARMRTTRLDATSYGLRIGIESDDTGVLAEVRRRLPLEWGSETSPVVDRMYGLFRHRIEYGRDRSAAVLRVNGEMLEEAADSGQLCETLVGDLQLYVAEMARQRAFIHAGVVGWRGSAIVLPGRSFCGKTRLVIALMRAGAEYYSDEYAVLDKNACVHPFPRLLSIRRDDGALLRRDTAEGLGGRRGTGPLPVGLVVVSAYEPGARWQPRRLSPGEAVLALLAHSVSVRRQPEAVLDTLARVVAGAPVLAGDRGEADELVAPLLSMLSPGGN
jgi:hypothetical protein